MENQEVVSIENEEIDQQEYVDCILKIIKNDIPIINKHNKHLSQIILSAIELVLDQSVQYIKNNIQMNEDTKQEVDDIIREIGEI